MGFQLFAKPRPKAKVASSSVSAVRAEKTQPATAGSAYILSIQSGKWAGSHPVELLSKERVAITSKNAQRTQRTHTAEEELEELQGEWELQSVRSKNLKRKHGLDHSKEPENTVQVFVRGKRVEEKSDKKRMFFNLVLAKKAAQSRTGSNDKQVAPDPKVSRHELPPLDGPKTLPESICKGKGKGKTKKGKGFKKGQRVHSVGHWILLHHTPKLLVRPDSKSSLLWWHPGEHSVWTRGGAIVETCVVRYLADSHTETLERHSDDAPGSWRTKKGVSVHLISR